MNQTQQLTAPPLGIQPRLTAPPLGMQTELELVSFQAFDADQDQAWNLSELDAYLNQLSSEQNTGFSTQSVSDSPFSASTLMQTYDINRNQLLEHNEAKVMHLSLITQIKAQATQVDSTQTTSTTDSEPTPLTTVTETTTDLIEDTGERVTGLTESLLPEAVSTPVTEVVETVIDTSSGLVSGLTGALTGQAPESDSSPQEPQKKKLLGLL